MKSVKPLLSALKSAPARPVQKRSGPGLPLAAAVKRRSGGRPPKYDEPSRPITVTLPESTLKDLEHIHEDRGQAIVKLTEAAQGLARPARPMVEIVEMAANTGLLVIGPCEPLRSIPFLHLVEVSPDRFVLALDPGNDFKTLEIAVQDVLEDLPEDALHERELILQLLGQIRQVRKSDRVSMAEILFVKLGGKHKGAALHSLVHTIAWLLALVA